MRYDEICDQCRKPATMLLTYGSGSRVCQEHYDEYYRDRAEWAPNAPYATEVVREAALRATDGTLFRLANTFVVGGAPGVHRVGDTLALPPYLGQHGATNATYSVTITSVGERYGRQNPIQCYHCRIDGRTGGTDW